MDELQCVKVQIKLDTVDKVKTFSERASVCPLDLDILQKRYIIDAKSVLGIFSCDLSQELTLVIHDGDKKEVEKFKQFIIVLTAENLGALAPRMKAGML